jgi:3-methyladenine DNA glycosylase Tag
MGKADDPFMSTYVDYHDQEWGVEVHNDRLLFEYLILEGAQAGLSWSIILKVTRDPTPIHVFHFLFHLIMLLVS